MKKRLLAWMMFLVMTLGLIPASAIEWVYAQPQLLSGDDSAIQVEETTVEVKYDDKDENRTTATITYHKEGLDAEPVNMIFLVDDSAKGEQSYRIFEQMMYDNGIEYVLGHWSATTAQLITYQNTADVGGVYTYDIDFRYALITHSGSSLIGKGTANEVAALEAALSAVEKAKGENSNPSVVFWVAGPELEKTEEEIEPKLAELKSALESGGGALVTWQYAVRPSELLTRYATQHGEAHDDPSEPKQPAAHAAANAIRMQEEMAAGLEELVHDHYHDIHFSLLLDDGQTMVKAITDVMYSGGGSGGSLTVTKRPDGTGLDVTVERLCRQDSLYFTLAVELDPQVYGKQTVIPAGKIVVNHDGTNGGLHTGLFDEEIEYGLELPLPEVVVDRTAYNITFQGVESAEGVEDITGKFPNQTVTLPTGEGITREGASFGGWKVVSGANLGRHYGPGEIIYMPEGDMVLEPAFGHVEVELEIDYEQGQELTAGNVMDTTKRLSVWGAQSNGITISTSDVVSVEVIDLAPEYEILPDASEVGGHPQVKLTNAPEEVTCAWHLGATDYDAVVAYLTPSETPGKYRLVLAGEGGVKVRGSAITMFFSFTSTTHMDLRLLDVSEVTSMEAMFFQCSSLQEVDVSGWDTSSVTTMLHMFTLCRSLTTITGISNWNVSNVTDMAYTFAICENLTELDLSGWDTSSVTTMESMFYSAAKLKRVVFGASGDNSTGINMATMFFQCSSLLDVEFGKNWKASNTYQMFAGCSSLTELDLSGWSVAGVVVSSPSPNESTSGVSQMFSGCSKLTTLDLSDWSVTGVTNMRAMFSACESLTTIDLSGFDTSGVTNMRAMFSGCESLTTIDLSDFDTSAVTSMSSMFEGCTSLSTLTFGAGWDTSAVTYMGFMFEGCTSLSNLTFGDGWDTSSVTDMGSMFEGCTSLSTLTFGNGWNTSSVTDMGSMFEGCTSLSTLTFGDGWNTSSVTDMSAMFSGCTSLGTLTFGNGWNTSGVTNMSSMFSRCTSLGTLTFGNGWNTSAVTNMSAMFNDCESLTTIDLSGFDTSAVTNMRSMFYGCENLTTLQGSFDISAVREAGMSLMFSGCTQLKSVMDFELGESNAVRSLDGLFSGLTALESVTFETPAGGAEFPELSTMENMFQGCTSLTAVDMSGWALPNLTHTRNMFSGCSSLTTLNLAWSNIRATGSYYISGMFTNVSGDATLESGTDGSNMMEAIRTAFQDNGGTVTTGGAPWPSANQLTQLEPPVEPPAEPPAEPPTEPPVETPEEIPEEAPEETPGEIPEEGLDEALGIMPISMLRMVSPPGQTDYAEKADSPLYVHDEMVSQWDTITYQVTVKYVGDVGVRSGRITLNFPIPEDIAQFQGGQVSEGGEFLDPGWHATTTAIRESHPGSSGDNVGGRVVEQPEVKQLSDGSFALQGVFEGLYTGTEVTVSIITTVQAKDEEDYNEAGYAFWDGTAYATDSAGTAVSRTVRLWNLKEDESGTTPTPPETKFYQLSYQFTGDVPSDAELPESVVLESGANVTAASEPTTALEGYTFDGWYRSDDGQPVTAGAQITMPESDLTLTGKWTLDDDKVQKITIRYQYTDNNDGQHIPDGAPEITQEQEIKVGYTHYIQKIDTDASYHTFGGWVPTLSIGGQDIPLTKQADGTYQSEDGAYVIDLPNGALSTDQFRGKTDVIVTFGGAWTPYKGTIQFDANGGTGTTAAMYNVTWDTKQTLTPNGFTYPISGYTFEGWTEESGSNEILANGASAAGLIDEDGKVVTLYAVWKRSTYGVAYDLSHVSSSEDTETVSLGGTYTTTLTVEDGYEMSEISITMGGVAITNQVYNAETGEVTIPNVSGNIYIQAKAAIFHTVTVSVTNGTARPSGTVKVEHGKNQTITFTPNSGYELESVTVDGAGASLTGNSYTFADVTADHSISVKYKKTGNDGGNYPGGSVTDKYPVHVDSTGSGTAQSDKDQAAAGEKVTITTDGTVEDIKVTDKNGNEIPVTDNGDGSYTFEMPKSEVTVTVEFDQQPGVEDPDDTGVSDWLNTKDHLAFMVGYDTGLFGADRDMTRAEAAQMFYNLLLNKDVPITVTFTDVPEDAWYATAVNTLASLGVIEGVGGGQFAPHQAITRAELTALAMRFGNEAAPGENIFSDITPDDWFYAPVLTGVQYGWITGYTDGTFRPNNTITRAEAATLTNKMLGRLTDQSYADQHRAELRLFPDVADTHWAFYQIVEATNSHDYTKASGNEIWQSLN